MAYSGALIKQIAVDNSGAKVILHPVPSSDPNDPLNWSTWRKTINFTLVSSYVLMTFVQLDISFTAWGRYQEELGFSVGVLNAGGAFNYSGLALLQPPYNFTPSSIGLMSLASFIGTFPGIFVGGYLNDLSILWLSKRNGGIYEPEMRLWLALCQTIKGHKRSSIMAPTAPVILNENYLRSKNSIRSCTGTVQLFIHKRNL